MSGRVERRNLVVADQMRRELVAFVLAVVMAVTTSCGESNGRGGKAENHQENEREAALLATHRNSFCSCLETPAVCPKWRYRLLNENIWSCLDVRGLEHIRGTPVEIAERLRRDVRARVGLPITVGVASTKFLAKVASGVAKPDGLLVVPAGREHAFLHPLPVERLWGVGPVTARRLHERGIRTVGEVAELPEELLVSFLGRAAGRHLHALAHNRDPRPVQVGRRRGSIGSQCALGRSRRSREDVDAVLVGLVDRITVRMRAAGRIGRTVVLRLRFGDFSRATRSHTLPRPTAQTHTILITARWLLATAEPE